MNHVRFLTSTQTICEKPVLLGYDAVVIDYGKGDTCRACMELLIGHNEKMYQYELLLTLPDARRKRDIPDPDFPLPLAILMALLAIIGLAILLIPFFN